MRCALLVTIALLCSCATAPPAGQSSMRLESVVLNKGPHGAEFAVLALVPAATLTDEESATARQDGEKLRGAISKALRDQGRSTLAPDWVDRNVAVGAVGAGVAGLLIISGVVGPIEAVLDDPAPWMRVELEIRMESGGQPLFKARARFAGRLGAEEAADMDADAREARLYSDLALHLTDELLRVLR